ncbi:MAG: preprotein translocase subunit SecE [Acutalibacteraceae bacterium]
MKKKKLNVFSKIKSFFIDCKVELKKIVWPSQKTVWKNTGTVLMTIFIMGVFVALLDAGLMQLLSLVMSVSSNM